MSCDYCWPGNCCGKCMPTEGTPAMTATPSLVERLRERDQTFRRVMRDIGEKDVDTVFIEALNEIDRLASQVETMRAAVLGAWNRAELLAAEIYFPRAPDGQLSARSWADGFATARDEIVARIQSARAAAFKGHPSPG